MKSGLMWICSFWLALGVVAGAGSSQAFRPLEGVFGGVDKVEEMVAPQLKKKHIRGKIQREEDFPFTILFVQDTTASFKEVFASMTESEISDFVDALDERHPSTKYGIISFSNEERNGTKSIDFVSDFTLDSETLEQFYSTSIPYGETEPKYGNNFEVLMAAAQANMQWPADDSVRLILHITDKVPRFFGDSLGDQLEVGQLPSSLFVEEIGGSSPPHSPAQVVSSMRTRGAYLAHLIVSPEYFTGDAGQAWQWFNRFMGQSDDFVNLLSPDGSDFAEKTLSIIAKIEEIELDGKTVNELRRLQEGDLPPPPIHPNPNPETRPTGPPATTKCQTQTILKKGVYVNLGYTPDVLNIVEGNESLVIESS